MCIMWHLSFVSNRLVLEYQTNTSTLANKVKVLFCFIGKFYLCNGEIDFLIILARSYIKPIVADLFEMFFWYVLNKPCNKIHYRNCFNNTLVIFMSIVMKSYIFAIVRINTRSSNNGTTKVTPNVLSNNCSESMAKTQ